MAIDGNIRVGELKRNTDKGYILRIYQNDDKAWDGQELESSRFIALEDYQDCFFQPPLHDLTGKKYFEKYLIANKHKGVDLLSDGFNGAWINKFVGSASSSHDLHFSRVELVRALNRDTD